MLKQRIFSGWNFNRYFFTIIGLVLIISTIQEFEWLGFFGGIYFISMGVFAFGCASGNCSDGNCKS